MSFDSANCLDNVIGLSQTTCECFEDAPIDYNVSLSGLYLDKLEGLDLNMANAGANCAHGTIWDILYTSRDSGTKQFRTFLFAGVTNEYKIKNEKFSGAIGESKFRSNHSVSGGSAGCSFYTNNIRGGYMKVKRIGTAFSQTGNFDIDIFNDLEDSAIDTINVSSEANKLKWNDVTPFFLPMANDTGEFIRYDFLYDTALIPGIPKDNKIWCGCGGKKNYYNESEPKFHSHNNTSSKWMNFVMCAGVSGSGVATTTDRDNLSRGIFYLNGLVLDVEFVCDIQDLICQSISDFDNGPLALAIATCIRYMSGVFLIDSILASGNISFYTMTDRERMMQKKNTYTKEFNNLLDQIIKQLNIDGNDCLICDNSNGPHKRGILS